MYLVKNLSTIFPVSRRLEFRQRYEYCRHEKIEHEISIRCLLRSRSPSKLHCFARIYRNRPKGKTGKTVEKFGERVAGGREREREREKQKLCMESRENSY